MINDEEQIEEQNVRVKKQCHDQLRDIGLTNFSIGFMFLIMSVSKSFYENDECIYLREKGLDFGIASLILSIFSLAFCFCIDQMEIKNAIQVHKFFTFLTFIIGFIFFVLLFLGVYKGEPCGALRILSIVYLVMVMFSLFCFLFVLCCLVLLTANDH
ncbi:unnamed protein product [Paramecium sonneborni]|uniref:CWH43-like N-terminal domain-containing protein n=1 Tax=Paramecium sonneborni TaxID=65129 RepID=A0A8S1MHY0_9CILI|nr:unnamed protein product [Paramecium sonneborni]